MKLLELYRPTRPPIGSVIGSGGVTAGSSLSNTNAVTDQGSYPEDPHGVPAGDEILHKDPRKMDFLVKGNITAHPDDDEQAGRVAARSPQKLKSNNTAQ